MEETMTCLTPSCANAPHIRGICASCFGKAYYRIRLGLTSLEALLANGRVVPKQRSGPKVAAKI